MSHSATAVLAGGGEVDRSFLWRRLHSLTGVLPVGAYLCYHLFENLTALKDPAAYNEMVEKINTMLPRPYFIALEVGAIMTPLVFHALYGFYVARTGHSNTSRYGYANNWLYRFQRVSGFVAFVYLLVHVGVLRGFVSGFGRHLTVHAPAAAGKLDLVTFNDVAAHLGNPVHMQAQGFVTAGNQIFALYLVGTLFTIFHFTNGLNGFAWTWGIAVGRVAQRRVQWFAWGLFLLMSVATLQILFTMRFAT